MTQAIRGYKTALRPTKDQEELFTKACGIARFAYNWGLERNNNVYLWNQLPHPPLKYESTIDQHRILNSRKANDYPWMYEVSKCAPQEALRDLGNAFHNFLIRRDRFRWPSFKSRHGAKHSRQGQNDSPSNVRLGQAEGAGISPGGEPCPVRHRLQEGWEVVRLHRRQEEEGQGPRERRRRPGSRCRLGYHPSGDGERRHHPREEPEAGAIEVAGEARPEGPRQESERGQEPPQSPPQAPEDMVPDYKHQG
ncbi:MAG: hypothetical protein E6K89_03360 [Thaumarchaeota archaeon]|nr:MAG: hypothetical protein E6K89_03360 [Nitrososphaerota archaeon]